MAVLALVATACTGGSGGRPTTGPPAGSPSADSSGSAEPSGSYAGRPRLVEPELAPGGGSLARLAGAELPSRTPAQAGPELAGRALPTGQWWTSALTGPWTQALWTFPVVARAGPDGLELSAPLPVASEKAVVQAAAPALLVGGPLTSVRVTDYGDFSVTLELARTAGALRTVLAQGNPVVPVTAPPGDLLVELRAAEQVRVGSAAAGAHDPAGDPPLTGPTRSDRLRVRASGQDWDLVSDREVRWERTATGLRASSGEAVRYAFAPVPDGADAQWQARVAAAAAAPVTGTSSVLTVDAAAGVVRQTLAWEGGSAAGRLLALPAHQRAALVPGTGTALAGRYRTSRGDLTLLASDRVELATPLPPALPGVPSVPLSQAEVAAVEADLRVDLATPDTTAAGSYYGPKALGRLATMLQIARRLRLPEELELTDRLRSGLEDWLTTTGPTDPHRLGYDRSWGTVTALPSEFGNSDGNDHHFQYGYLLQAAATLAEADPDFARRYRAAVDLLAADVLGGDLLALPAAFPPFRVWNAWQGHSTASGFAAVPDGNDQESTSEAVNAWDAIARWGLVTGRPAVQQAGQARYAVEALAARTYWLGAGERLWPAAYAHDTAGIVWGGKIDFATFFDGRPEAVLGIQLLPVSYASLYRADEATTRRRSATARTAGGGVPSLWPDLFLLDLAPVDPAAALAGFGAGTPIEPGSSRSFTRYWLMTFARLGAARLDVVADPPIGIALGGTRGGAAEHLLAVNPTDTEVTVTWRLQDGRTLGSTVVAPKGAATVVP